MALRVWLMSTFDWVFMGTGNLSVLFCLLLVVTPLGRVRLGGANARPDYSRSAWFAMLFAAGTGIGLMFFWVSEPVEHFLHPPLGLKVSDAAATRLGMAASIYHWGIHGWAMYAVVALSIAFASYNLGQYLAPIGPLSNWVGREDLHFMHGWTTFFWGWWISWSPFVGLFLARISRGRTVRELIASVLVVPTLIAAIWMNAFGGTAVSQYLDRGHPDVIAAVQAQQPEIALFAMLETLPLANLTSFIGIVLVVVFFVTVAPQGSWTVV